MALSLVDADLNKSNLLTLMLSRMLLCWILMLHRRKISVKMDRRTYHSNDTLEGSFSPERIRTSTSKQRIPKTGITISGLVDDENFNFLPLHESWFQAAFKSIGNESTLSQSRYKILWFSIINAPEHKSGWFTKVCNQWLIVDCQCRFQRIV